MKRVVLLAALAAAALSPAVAFARPPDATRVVGGTTVTGADPGPFPFMSALVFQGAPNDFVGQFCGGSLIASDRVLTAAHCVYGSDRAAVVVVVGRKRLSGTGGQRLPVSGFAVDPDYNPKTGANDVAMVLLAGQAGAANAPIATVNGSPSSDDALWAPGTHLRLIGWGATTSDGKSFPDDLQQGTVTRRPDDTCTADYASVPQQFDAASELCADGPTTAACFGDSGGPLFTQGSTPRQVGVVSFGGGGPCLDPAHPAVFARLGSPPVNTFVHGATPVIQPFPTAKPSIAPAPVVGTASTCEGAQFGGSPVTSQQTVWGRRTGSLIETVGTGAAYTPSAPDVGHSLVCAVAAFNAGGLGIAQSDPSPAVVEPSPSPTPTEQASTNSPTTTPTTVTPAPAPAPTPTAGSAPRAVVLSRSCAHRRCKFVVAVSDPAADITATLQRGSCHRAHRGARCRRSRAVPLKPRRTGPDRFTLVTGRLKPGRYTFAIRATGQVIPTTVRVRVR